MTTTHIFFNIYSSIYGKGGDLRRGGKPRGWPAMVFYLRSSELVVHILTYVEDAAVVKAKTLNEPASNRLT